VLIATETPDALGDSAVDFLRELGRRIASAGVRSLVPHLIGPPSV